MTRSLPDKNVTPENISDMFRNYLQKQTEAHTTGLGFPEANDEILPFEAVPVQPVDPALAWEEALYAATFFPDRSDSSEWKTPPEWASLVNGLEPAVDLAFSLGNFPQLVRHVHPLLTTSEPPALRKTTRTTLAPSLPKWAEQVEDTAEQLLAVGVLTLAGHFEAARERLDGIGDLPEGWNALKANEEAALLWHSGEGEKALELWKSQEESVPVLFNIGMACLFLGQPEEAQTALTRAVEQLPETSSWHHLGQLYLALTR